MVGYMIERASTFWNVVFSISESMPSLHSSPGRWKCWLPLENPSLRVEQEQLFLKVQRKEGAIHPKADNGLQA